MRALIMSRSMAFLFLWSASGVSSAFALQQEFSSTYTMNSNAGAISQSSLSNTASGRISSMNANFSYLLDGLPAYLNASGSVTLSRPNYQNYLLRNAQGESRALSDSLDASTEIYGLQTLGWNHGIHNASITWNGSLNSSPFASQAVSLSYQLGFFEKATIFGIRATYLAQQNPEDYFINRAFQNQSRPRLVHGTEIVGTYEQLLSERWKMYMDLSTAQRLEERPRNFGVTLGQGYALTNRVTLQLKGSRFDELRSDPLLNERGYFSLTAGEFSVAVEPVYDLLITLSYGLSVERELDPTTGAETQVATDLFGMGLRYSFRKYEIRLQGGLGSTNTTYQTLNFSGGVIWRI